MFRFILILAATTVVVSCASKTVNESAEPNLAAKQVHDDVIELLLARQDRQPASALSAVGARITDLNRIRPGKFEVYVFPKISNRASKEAAYPEEMLGSPRVFDVSLIAETPCRSFVQQNFFATLRPLDLFPVELTQNPQRRCAIVEVTARDVARANRALLKKDDHVQVRLFLDDEYRLHGYDLTLVDASRGQRVVRVKNDPLSPASSGLSSFPIDLPGIDSRVSAPANPAQYVAQRVDLVAQQQIRRKHNRAFQVPSCQGNIWQSLDYYGQPAMIGWCRGLPWPHFIENSRFISVTQPLVVR